MVNISKRAKQMPPSPIRKLAPYADAAKQRGVKVYHLNIGQPDIPTPDLMLDAFRNHNISVLAYGHSGGLWEYREGLAQYYQQCNIDVTKEQILVTTAGSEAIIFAMLATMDEGDEMLVTEPFYTNYQGFAIQAGIELVALTCKAEDGFAFPPDEAILPKITSRTRAIMINNPNNPTGHVYTREELQRVRSLVLKHNLFLLSDEVYREFVYDGAQHHSAMHLEGIEERVILLDSISKRYSACGARIGCLVTRNQEILETVLRFGQARLCPPTMEQIAALALLDSPPEYFDQLISEYRQRRDVVFEALSGIPGILCRNPKGAFYVVAKLPIDDSDTFCTWLLNDFQDQQETVMLSPAGGFYLTPGLGKDEIRIAFVLNSNDMKRAMEILEKALRVYPGKTSE